MSREVSWEDHRAFLAVVDSGSLSGAARLLGLSQPTVRARIETLEMALGTALFTRSVHGLKPTAQAIGMAAPARAMAHAADALLRAASADAETAAGTVRLSVSEFIGIEVVPPMLKRLWDAHPNIVVEVDLSNAAADVLDQQADIAVRMHPPAQGALIARKVPAIKLGLFAHRDYLATFGTPRSRDEIDHHLFVGPDGNRTDHAIAEKIAGGRPLRWSMCTDSHPAQLAAARAGMGIAIAQTVIGARDPDLVRVLSDIDMPQLDTWIVTHENLRRLPRIAAVFDHLVAEFDAYGHEAD